MVDVYETEMAYEAVCKKLCKSSNPMIRDVIAIDKEENLMYSHYVID